MNAPSSAKLLQALSALRPCKMVLVGDIMLDIFTYGVARRISPEAPIPVKGMTSEIRMLGGVGNVGRNIVA